ncbi:lysophospholipase [Desulfobotulus sp. H1]|uniref:Lysophospholipase n=1 Tax=Desulfobotulus pelophilus TaxID=2823377 RepID=A0ABT3N7D4_9BACT|nr:alpha/beta fold hydrolase [Desulfobotulus pelophilus]MCW7753372.1 lysophospholipase [Desulfobotulus pelophilus]
MTDNRVLAALNHPAVQRVLFHPRPDDAPRPLPPVSYKDMVHPDGIRLSGEHHSCGTENAPLILFFHGNGEIASEYRELAPFFTALGWDFLVMDYRGYGRSKGEPTAISLQEDALWILDSLHKENPDRPIALMGRSLGSAAVLHAAARRPQLPAALIVESGFADTQPLIRLLGADMKALGIPDDADFGNLEGVRTFRGPTLIIHGENDHVIPLAQAQKLKNHAAGHPLSMVIIPTADHNTLFYYGLKPYFTAIASLLEAIPDARI